MSVFTVEACLNISDDGSGFFFGYRDSDPLERVGTFTVEADGPHAAGEMIFEVGNIGTPDAAGRRWPSHTRSLSVGDVLNVIGGGTVTKLAVARFGFTEV